MNAYEAEIGKYHILNALAGTGGTVVFGGTADREIPVSELKQSFGLIPALYNRSLSGLTLERAVRAYDEAAAPLVPERVLLHLGEADTERFESDPAGFDSDYRALIAHIRMTDRKCDVIVVSLKNPEGLPKIDALNRHLKNLAASERCEFCDINTQRVWNPAAMKETIAFLYSAGFVRPLHRKMPAYDLVRILYSYDSACEAVPEAKTEPRRAAGPSRLPKASIG